MHNGLNVNVGTKQSPPAMQTRFVCELHSTAEGTTASAQQEED